MIDIFSSHHHEIAKNFSKQNYDTPIWKKFYESLQFIYEIEREMSCSEIILNSTSYINERMHKNINLAQE